MNKDSVVKNAIGRDVPTTVNNVPAVPFKGVGKHRPAGRKYSTIIPTCADYPQDGNKLVPSLKEALVRSGLRDGVTISTHHHFRDGD
ncbi:MAG: citrate lyase subunit alpha, partial [Desulfuromonadaceae bacterium]